jgi:hypothetical protein
MTACQVLLHNGFGRIGITDAPGRFLPFLGHIRRINVDCLRASVAQRIVGRTRGR